MAIRIRTKRLATSATNPRRVSRKPRPNPPKRRKMSDKQIRHFGTKRQKAALVARKHRTRTAPARVVSSSRTSSSRAKRSPNPAWIVTVGQALNPNRRSKPMAAKKAKKRKVSANRTKTRRRVAKRNPVRKTRRRSVNRAAPRRRRRSNPKVVIRYRTKKRNTRRRSVSRRNPEIFGARLGSKDSLKMIGGGIAGVAAAKFLPTLLPASMLSGVATSNIGKTAISLGAALVAGWAASKLDPRFGQGVYFGGIMQAASVALNTFLPSVYKTLNIGMGDFVPGQFAVPQNPVRAGIAPPVPAHAQGASGSRVTMSGLARAYAPAY